MIQIDVLEFLIEKGPGRTQVELAKAIHGHDGYRPGLNRGATAHSSIQDRPIWRGQGCEAQRF
jgi:hypothetical protein